MMYRVSSSHLSEILEKDTVVHSTESNIEKKEDKQGHTICNSHLIDVINKGAQGSFSAMTWSEARLEWIQDVLQIFNNLMKLLVLLTTFVFRWCV